MPLWGSSSRRGWPFQRLWICWKPAPGSSGLSGRACGGICERLAYDSTMPFVALNDGAADGLPRGTHGDSPDSGTPERLPSAGALGCTGLELIVASQNLRTLGPARLVAIKRS